jgi:hypothetical protein
VFFAGQQNTSLAWKLIDQCLDAHHHPVSCLVIRAQDILGKGRRHTSRGEKVLLSLTSRQRLVSISILDLPRNVKYALGALLAPSVHPRPVGTGLPIAYPED